MEAEKKIVVIGTIFMDIKGYPEEPFRPADRNKGRISYRYGGVGRNVAQDLAAMGLHPVFVSLAGEGAHDAAILRDLTDSGVDTGYILRQEKGIGTWLAILTPQGDVCANLSERQDLTPLCDFLKEQGDRIFRDADGVLLEMDVEEAVVAQVFAFSQKYRLDVYGVISNMTIALQRLSYICRTRCFICNRTEAGLLFSAAEAAAVTADRNNRKTDSVKHQYREEGPAVFGPPETAIEAADIPVFLEILKKKRETLGMQCLVVTLDKDGAVFAAEDGQAGYCPPRNVPVTDTTGAGDAFFAGVSAGLILGMDPESACRQGTQMAARVIQSEENTLRHI